MKNLKFKILFSIFIFFCILFLKNNVNANVYYQNIEFPDFPHLYYNGLLIFYRPDRNRYTLIDSPGDFRVNPTATNGSSVGRFDASNPCYVYQYFPDGSFEWTNRQYYGSTYSLWNVARFDSNTNNNIIYSNINVNIENSSEIFYTKNETGPVDFMYNVSLSSTSSTNEPITVYTNYFNYSERNRFNSFIAYSKNGGSSDLYWVQMKVQTLSDGNGNTKFRYYYQLYRNGTYYFHLTNNGAGGDKYLTLTVNNLVNDSYILPTNDNEYTDFDNLYNRGQSSQGVDYNVTLSTNYNTSDYITAYTNYFNINYSQRLNSYIAYKKDSNSPMTEFTPMNIETLSNNGVTTFRFNYKIYKNGTYYFKLTDTLNNDKVVTITVNNIINDSILIPTNNSDYNNYNDLYNNGGSESSYNLTNDIPTPYVTYSRIGEEFELRTQSLATGYFNRLKCLYIKKSDDLDLSSFPNWDWSEMNIKTLTNEQTKTVDHYFYFNVPRFSDDCSYIFVFYDFQNNKYGNIATLNCDFDKMNEYADTVQGSIDNNQDKLSQLADFFSNKFGFLTYPFKFITDLFDRISNITYSEPIINIPEISIPNSDVKIFDGYSFNLNSILSNTYINYLYNIYLIAVDFIIIIMLLNYAKNVLMGVLSNV